MWELRRQVQLVPCMGSRVGTATSSSSPRSSVAEDSQSGRSLYITFSRPAQVHGGFHGAPVQIKLDTPAGLAAFD